MSLKYIIMAAMCLMFESNASSWGNTNTIASLRNTGRRLFYGSRTSPTVPYGQITTQVSGNQMAHFKHSLSDDASLSDLVYVDYVDYVDYVSINQTKTKTKREYRIINLTATSRNQDDYRFCPTDYFKLPFYIKFGNTPISLIGQKIDDPKQYILLVVRSQKDLSDPTNIEKIELTQADVAAINSQVENLLSHKQAFPVQLNNGYSLTLELHSRNLTGWTSKHSGGLMNTTTYANYWIKYSIVKPDQKSAPTLLSSTEFQAASAQGQQFGRGELLQRPQFQSQTYLHGYGAPYRLDDPNRGGYPQQIQGQPIDVGGRLVSGQYRRPDTPAQPAQRPTAPTQQTVYPQTYPQPAPAPRVIMQDKFRSWVTTGAPSTTPAPALKQPRKHAMADAVYAGMELATSAQALGALTAPDVDPAGFFLDG